MFNLQSIEVAIWLILGAFLILIPLIKIASKICNWLVKSLKTVFILILTKLQKAKKQKQILAELQKKIKYNKSPQTTKNEQHKPPKNSSDKEIKNEDKGKNKQHKGGLRQKIAQRKAQKIKEKLKDIKIQAITLKERGKMVDYEKKLIEGLALDPQNPDFIEMLGDYYFDTKQYKKAFSLFKKIIKDQKDDHAIIWKMAKIYSEIGEPQNAKLLIQKAIEKKPDNIKYLTTLADIEYNLGNYSQCITALKKIAKLRPKSAKYLIAIANVFEELGETERAQVFIQKAFLLDPDDPLVKERISK